jgi:hypothetical protein
MLAGFMEGRKYAEIVETIFKVTGKKVSTRTVCRRRQEWLAAERLAQVVQVFTPGEAMAATRWRSDEIAELVAKIDRTPGSYSRRKTEIWWAVRLFMKSPGPERLHELCELLLLFLFEREFESLSLPTQAAPGSS